MLRNAIRTLSIVWCTVVLCAAARAQAPEPVEISLWPQGAPQPQYKKNEERVEKGLVFSTYQPTLRVFQPEAGKATGAAVIVCPGGGYNVLEYEREGVKVAQRLTEFGVTGIVLKYRLHNFNDPKDTDDKIAARALLDGKRAVRVARAHAAEWGINPQRIGMGGFSAGSHLATNVATHFDRGNPKAADPVERVSCRPDFLMLVYTYTGDMDKRVTRDTPPAFLAHGAQDSDCDPGQATRFFLALNKVHVPAELHIFNGAKHGFDLGQPGQPVAEWPNLFRNWMAARGYLKVAKQPSAGGQ